MSRFIKISREKIGKAPGELLFVGTKRVEEPTIEALVYDPESIEFHKNLSTADIASYKELSRTAWINVVGVHDPDMIRTIGDIFQIHPVILEDIMHTGQLPKFQDEEHYLFIVVKMLELQVEKRLIESEQISFLVLRNCLITFQEAPGDVFNAVRDRLGRENARIRKRGADYLAYALLDSIVDRYVEITERFGERIEKVENEILIKPRESHLHRIRTYKREINFLRKTVRPVRELTMQFHKSENPLIVKPTRAFMNDLLDHIKLCTEAIETYYEMLNDLLGLYNMMLNDKLNDIIRVLTVFSVIFIPLTFLAGIYGTNFKYLPELEYRYAYPIFWGVLIVIAIVMIFFFKRKRWL